MVKSLMMHYFKVRVQKPVGSLLGEGAFIATFCRGRRFSEGFLSFRGEKIPNHVYTDSIFLIVHIFDLHRPGG